MARVQLTHWGMPPPRSGDDCLCSQRGQQLRVPHHTEGSVNGESPVLDTLAEITAAWVEYNSLAPRELMLMRIAALIAVYARLPPTSPTPGRRGQRDHRRRHPGSHDRHCPSDEYAAGRQ